MAYIIGAGTTVARLTTPPSTYTTITQVKEVTPPALEMGTAEATHLTSTAREHVATILDPGEVSFSILWDPDDATHLDLWTTFQAKTVSGWKITIVDATATDTTITFDGLIKNFGIDTLDVEAIAMIPVTIQVSGLPVITTS
jgi:hypothetical protein